MGNIVGYLFVAIAVGLGILVLVPSHWLPGFWNRLGQRNDASAPRMRDLSVPSVDRDEDDDMFKPLHDWSKPWNSPDSHIIGDPEEL